MNKFEKRRQELQEKMNKDLERIEAEERAETRKVVVPMAGKFSALMSEELERYGNENVGKISDYKFLKPVLRKKIREFIEQEFGGVPADQV